MAARDELIQSLVGELIAIDIAYFGTELRLFVNS